MRVVSIMLNIQPTKLVARMVAAIWKPEARM